MSFENQVRIIFLSVCETPLRLAKLLFHSLSNAKLLSEPLKTALTSKACFYLHLKRGPSFLGSSRSSTRANQRIAHLMVCMIREKIEVSNLFVRNVVYRRCFFLDFFFVRSPEMISPLILLLSAIRLIVTSFCCAVRKNRNRCSCSF